MSVYKEPKTNTWKVYYRYTDWQGERKQTTKRGFATKREALAWEREQIIPAVCVSDGGDSLLHSHGENDKRLVCAFYLHST